MMDPATGFVRASDHSLLVRLGQEISLEHHRQVVRLLRLLQESAIPGVRDLSPAYSSILIRFHPLELTHAEVEARLRELWPKLESVELPEPKRVEIPVSYGGEFGPDIEDVARHCGLSVAEVIALHSGVEYRVYFLGFSPGFAYLGGLAEALATPRLAKPRREVPAGSVGIAGQQTGVYPLATPGGWRLIGRTSLRLFDARREPMSLLEIGDLVRFVPAART
jgi:KipI family sensor histidine kinase inhibitor